MFRWKVMKDRNALEPELYHALRRLSVPASDQIEYLRKLGTFPSIDELALELDDVIFVVRTFLSRGVLTADEAEAIYAVSRKLKSMSGQRNARLWTEEALRESEDWADVRSMAASTLQSLERTAKE